MAEIVQKRKRGKIRKRTKSTRPKPLPASKSTTQHSEPSARDRWLASFALAALLLILVPRAHEAYIHWWAPQIERENTAIANMEEFIARYCFARDNSLLLIANSEDCGIGCSFDEIEKKLHLITWEETDFMVCGNSFDLTRPNALQFAESILGARP